jgi:hypothetical protein
VYTSDFNLFGWLTIANGGLCLLMGARNNVFAVVARVPSATLLMYHRWTGLATVTHATIHFATVTRPWLTTSAAKYTFQNRRDQVGIMAWCSLCIIAISSLTFMRRKWFKTFYYTYFVFLSFVIGALIHASHGPEFLLPGLILWVFDRLIRFRYNLHSVEIEKATQWRRHEADDPRCTRCSSGQSRVDSGCRCLLLQLAPLHRCIRHQGE